MPISLRVSSSLVQQSQDSLQEICKEEQGFAQDKRLRVLKI